MTEKTLFGEYLLKLGKVKADDLLGALFEQQRALPSTAELARKMELLDVDQMLQVLAHQSRTHKDFISSCRELGFWREEFTQKILSELQSLRRPLGEILVSRGVLTLAALGTALEDYLFENGKKSEIESQTAPDSVPAIGTPNPAEGSDRSDPLKQYLEVFSPEARAALDRLMQHLAIEEKWDGVELDMHIRLSELAGAAGAAQQRQAHAFFANLVACAASAAKPIWIAEALQALNALWGQRERLGRGEIFDAEPELDEIVAKIGADSEKGSSHA